jgi:hypothetical protein
MIINIQKNTNMSYMPWLYEDINKQQAVRLLKENHFGKFMCFFFLIIIIYSQIFIYILKLKKVKVHF